MFVEKKNSKLNLIIQVTEKLNNSKLDKDVLNEASGSLDEIGKYLGVSAESALFFSIIFVLQNQKSDCVTLRDIADFLDYSFIQILTFRECLKELEDESLVFNSSRSLNESADKCGYRIENTIMNNVIDDAPILKVEKEKPTDIYILYCLYAIMTDYARNHMTVVEYRRSIAEVEREYADSELIFNICKNFPDDFESRIALYELCSKPVTGEDFILDPEDSKSPLIRILPKNRSGIDRITSLRNGTDKLIKKNLVLRHMTRVGGRYRSNIQLSYDITPDGIKLVFPESWGKYVKDDAQKSELEKTIEVIKEIACNYESSMDLNEKRTTIASIERNHQDLEFFRNIKKLVPLGADRVLLYDCVSDSLDGEDSCLTRTVEDLYGNSARYFAVIRAFLSEKHFLVKEGFVEVNQSNVVEQTTLRLGERTLDLFYGKDAGIFKKKNESKNIIQPKDLKRKKLFYSDEVKSQVKMLQDSLEQENFVAMQKRLEQKGLCKGVAGILYGAPGTGKTESVYQIAKKTNRKIFHVDIADSKSMWFGESEKQIKRIFVNYRKLCDDCKRQNLNTPILLFNEADAIISKRKSDVSQSVSQTENAMQNILLEEMEKFDGILIATTNLSTNMDKAFERRFLFKIKFEKPTVEARSNIWLSKLPELQKFDAVELSKAFDFSGGEIDNIVRKCQINEVINGTKPTLELLKDFCMKERLENEEARHMGFCGE